MSAIAPAHRLTPVPQGRVTQLRVIHSEWTKLRSVRSTRWALFTGVLATIGIAALACAIASYHYPRMSPQDRADFHPLEVNLAGVQLAQLAIGVLGVLVITAEYSTGMIRSSFTAVPKRLSVLWAKAIVYGLTLLALMIPSVLVAFVVGESLFSRHHINIPFSHHGVARAVIGAGLYLTVVGLFGLGLGAIFRNTAGGISAFAALMFVLPPLMNVLPSGTMLRRPICRSPRARPSFRSRQETICHRGSASRSSAATQRRLLQLRPFYSYAAIRKGLPGT
jgi:ABC-2 type transport system permease protein